MSGEKVDLEAFLSKVSAARPSALLTPEKTTEKARLIFEGEEDQMMANLSLVGMPKQEEGNTVIPTAYGEYSKIDKKYSLFITPSSQEELESFCFKNVGQGSYMCIRQGCSI